ncbi:MAG: hypothetical protein HY611_06825 [Elusimicrobia bacterium]|nr:hypothetical protein [Elusimicrobiota bacterium]
MMTRKLIGAAITASLALNLTGFASRPAWAAYRGGGKSVSRSSFRASRAQIRALKTANIIKGREHYKEAKPPQTAILGRFQSVDKSIQRLLGDPKAKPAELKSLAGKSWEAEAENAVLIDLGSGETAPQAAYAPEAIFTQSAPISAPQARAPPAIIPARDSASQPSAVTFAIHAAFQNVLQTLKTISLAPLADFVSAALGKSFSRGALSMAAWLAANALLHAPPAAAGLNLPEFDASAKRKIEALERRVADLEKQSRKESKTLKFLKSVGWGGSVSMEYKNTNPRFPHFERQIQHNFFLSDMFFHMTTPPIVNDSKFHLEFKIPGDAETRTPQLYRAFMDLRYKHWGQFILGKDVLPYAFNHYYRPEHNPNVTHDILTADAARQDVQARLGAPAPYLTRGYAPLGIRASALFDLAEVVRSPLSSWLPSTEFSFGVLNGLNELGDRNRVFQDRIRLDVEGFDPRGVYPDPATDKITDLNNEKDLFLGFNLGWGDFKKFRSEIQTSKTAGSQGNKKGLQAGLSFMSGRYDLEAYLNYRMASAYLEAVYKALGLRMEYTWNSNDFRALQLDLQGIGEMGANAIAPTARESTRGYAVTAMFPLVNKMPVGKKLSGSLRAAHFERRGPKLVFSQNGNPNDDNLPVAGFPFGPRLESQSSITHLTAAVTWELSEYFFLIAETNRWDIRSDPFRGRAPTDTWEFARLGMTVKWGN